MTRRGLLLVLLVALASRAAVFLELSGAPFRRVLLGDAARYDAWARELAAGNWLGSEVFYQAPLYPYLLGLLYVLGGGWTAALVVQACLGAAAAGLAAAATARLFDARTGLVAGLGAALYAPSIWHEGMLQKTALATFLGALLVWLTAREVVLEDERDPGEPRLASTLAAGLVLGLLALVRENSLVLLPVLMLATWRRPGAPLAVRARALGALLLGTALVLVPVGARNAGLGGAFLPTTSNAGVNFYLGNRLEADGQYTPLVPGRGHPRFEAEDARRQAEEALGRELSAAEVSAHFLRRGLADVRAEPSRWMRLAAWKTVLVLHRSEQMDSEAYEAHRDRSRVLDLLGFVVGFGLLLPLFVLGAGLALQARPGVWPLLLAPTLLAASIVLFFVAGRFRAGLVPWLLPFAARGAVELARAAREPRRLLANAPLLGAALLAALLANLPTNGWPIRALGFELAGDAVATTESNVSSALLRAGDAEGARAAAARAIERLETLAPRDLRGEANAFYNLGRAELALDLEDEAIGHLQEALHLEPAYAAECLSLIGIVHAERGELEEALLRFDAALDHDPRYAVAHFDRGLALRQLGRTDEAARAYESALRLDPGFVDAHHNLGFVRELQERWPDAIAEYRAALREDPDFVRSLTRLARIRALHPDAALRDGAEAVELARRLVALEPEPTVETLELLAAALAEAGDAEGARLTRARADRLRR